MREIKFRGWVYYGEKLDKPDYSRDYGSLDRFFEDHSENDCDQCIEQYTGSKDKNGKEIYEGDILDTPSGRCLCVWSDDGWAYQFKMHRTDWFDIVKEFHKNSEVIGNIHENPELFGGEE